MGTGDAMGEDDEVGEGKALGGEVTVAARLRSPVQALAMRLTLAMRATGLGRSIPQKTRGPWTKVLRLRQAAGHEANRQSPFDSFGGVPSHGPSTKSC
jgi:hypothetical protein